MIGPSSFPISAIIIVSYVGGGSSLVHVANWSFEGVWITVRYYKHSNIFIQNSLKPTSAYRCCTIIVLFLMRLCNWLYYEQYFSLFVEFSMTV
jgi:uncharacterized membrane protein required for colicin V production